MQLYKTTNSVNSIFLGFWTMVQSRYNVEKVLENTCFVFCILDNAFQRLLLVDTNKKSIESLHSNSWVLQCTAQYGKERRRNFSSYKDHWSYMEHFFKSFVCLGHISQNFTQNYQRKLSIDAGKYFCLFLKSQRYYHSKLVDF